ncbi:hypothetical protein VNO78_08008 [Psophocarpus tetragonolobus]|uniref:Uncharacterized protein n=1 Tax=Psophocarpus tetragonolobus TaxID=3891 RepID=A0AAN9SU22_PSOTE
MLIASSPFYAFFKLSVPCVFGRPVEKALPLLCAHRLKPYHALFKQVVTALRCPPKVAHHSINHCASSKLCF